MNVRKKVSVADLRVALDAFKDDAIVAIMFESRDECAIVAVMDEHLDVLRGRMSDDSCTVAVVEKLS
jgi:hypothetical protein